MTQQAPQTASTEPDPELTGVRNFRDVGGLPADDGRRVRHGRLFRSGHLAHATKDDKAFLASLGLHTVFDFRNSVDIKLEGPDVELTGVRYVNMPLSDPAHGAEFWQTVHNGSLDALRTALGDGRAADRMVEAYRHIIVDRTAEHSRLLELLAGVGSSFPKGGEEGESVPALLHCAAGKDRAGTSIAIILLALGVRRDAIKKDYLESNAAHRRYVIHRSARAEPAATPEVMELLSPLFEARLEYLEASFDTIDEHWGSVDSYLTEGLGCTPERRGQLRELLLEDPS